MKLTTKALHITAKNGLTLEEAIQKFGFESEETFLAAIARITNRSKANFFKREFQQNSRRSHTTSKEKNMVDSVEILEITTAQELQESSQQADNDQQEQCTENPLEKLRQNEQELSAKCIELEGKHKELYQKRMQIRAQLAQTLNILRELKRLVQANSQKITALKEENLTLASEMSKVMEDLEPSRTLLSEVREEIREMEKVTIFIYENGNLETENGAIPGIDPDSVEEVFKKLVSHPEAENLKIKEVKAIATLKILVSTLEGSYGLIFENPKAQDFWEACQ